MIVMTFQSKNREDVTMMLIGTMKTEDIERTQSTNTEKDITIQRSGKVYHLITRTGEAFGRKILWTEN
jgi:hypothetical protein